MWKLNKSIAKELLPTQPVDFPIEPWWGICLVNFTLEEFKKLSEEEVAAIDKILYPEDRFKISRLEGFVSNREQSCEDPIEELLHDMRKKLAHCLALLPKLKGDISNEHPASADNGGLTKLVRNSADASGNVLIKCSSGSVAPGQQLTVSNPVRTSAKQTAVGTLEDAARLKESAVYYKNSGFGFESNETYFHAGLKFLHGGSLLKSCQRLVKKLFYPLT
ncbi:hypothetical protein KIW84_070397 [Lathyrus oleraceus]|uniref:FAM91 N-terminal domain-containing protein n=1 Tax=Pisum sativum TaxID=3888 RepID=A0A9D4ZUF2_PEA|nr:hypothetical protein KIW84_070397 [Pisum sativum]